MPNRPSAVRAATLPFLRALCAIALACCPNVVRGAQNTETSFGQPATSATGQQSSPALVVDQYERTLLAWTDTHLLNRRSIVLTLRNADGSLAAGWDPNGMWLTSPPTLANPPQLIRLDTGWALCIWTERGAAGPWGVKGLWIDTRGSTLAPPDTSASFSLGSSQDEGFLTSLVAVDSTHCLVGINRINPLGRGYFQLAVVSPPSEQSVELSAGLVLSDSLQSYSIHDLTAGEPGTFFLAYSTTSDPPRRALRHMRLDGSTCGNWPDSGMTIRAKSPRGVIRIAASPQGGCFAAWTELDSLGLSKLKATYFGPTAVEQVAGQEALASSGSQDFARIATMANGDAVVACLDDQNNAEQLFLWGLTPSGGTPAGWSPLGLPLNSPESSLLLDFALHRGSEGTLLLAWSELRGAFSTTGDIYLSALTQDGEVLPQYNPGGTLICGAQGSQSHVALAISPATQLPQLAWSDSRNDDAGDIYFARIAADGTVPIRPEWRFLRWTLREPTISLAWTTPRFAPDNLAVLRAIDGAAAVSITPTIRRIGPESLVMTDEPPPCHILEYCIRSAEGELLSDVRIQVPRQPTLQLASASATATVRLRIELPAASNGITLTAFDIQGRRLFARDFPRRPEDGTLHVTLPTTNWPSGLYIATLSQIGDGHPLSSVRFTVLK